MKKAIIISPLTRHQFPFSPTDCESPPPVKHVFFFCSFSLNVWTLLQSMCRVWHLKGFFHIYCNACDFFLCGHYKNLHTDTHMYRPDLEIYSLRIDWEKIVKWRKRLFCQADKFITWKRFEYSYFLEIVLGIFIKGKVVGAILCQ